MDNGETRTDEFGRVIAKGLHDSVLVSLQLQTREKASLEFRAAHGPLLVVFEGLGDFGIEGLREGAIAATLWAHDLGSLNAPPIEAWEILWAGDMRMGDPGTALLVKRSAAAFRYLAVVECSYGGRLACLCNRVWVGQPE